MNTFHIISQKYSEIELMLVNQVNTSESSQEMFERYPFFNPTLQRTTKNLLSRPVYSNYI